MFRAYFRLVGRRETTCLKGANGHDCRGGCDNPSQEAPPAAHIGAQPLVQSLTESRRQFGHPFVPVQLDNVAGAHEHSRAVIAASEMLINRKSQIRVDFSIEIIRDFAPHFFAADYHDTFPFA
jgi:hypothetical protein